MRSKANITIVKLGGSLLEWEDLPSRFNAWISKSRLEKVVVVLGGGAGADLIRRRQKREGWTDAEAHWLAVKKMNSNAQTMHAVVDGFQLCDSLENLVATRQPRTMFLPVKWCRKHVGLPQDWTVTSDSIAAELGRQVAELSGGESRLVLLKSRLPPEESNLNDWVALAKSGIVDDYFPEIAPKIGSIKLVNLRSESTT